MKLKAILVDDEQDSRHILANYLQKYCPDVEVLAMADSVATGLEAIEKHQPDIVFLDIEMPYGNGFDLLEQVPAITFETIFVTAFDHYAIQALNLSAAYYLLKPIAIEELIKAVDKIRQERQEENPIHHAQLVLDNLRAESPQNQRLLLPTLEGFEVVEVKNILYCEAEDNFTRFHFSHGPALLICRTLKHFEEVLATFHFIRIHRSYLINPSFVKRYTKGKGGFVTMENGKELEVSPNKKQEFLQGFYR